MREVVVAGAGMHKFGRFPDKTIVEIGNTACQAALKDAGLKWRDIEAAYCGHAFQGSVVGERIAASFGYTGIPVVNVENACASGSTAFLIAYQAVAGGFKDIALAVGAEKMERRMIDVQQKGTPEVTMRLLPPPVKYALEARRYMEEYGLTLEQLAKVSVKNHRNGCYNPYSQYQQELTIEEVLGSRMICDPLTLYQCCPSGDGAAAVVICTDEIARRLTMSGRPLVRVASASLTSQAFVRGETGDPWELTVRAAKEAYEKAGVGPEDLDVIELHDCFTMAEIGHYEDFGLCARGEGMRLIHEGATELGGRIPVNPSGGLLAKGHPIGATGIAQLVELVWQLRGEAGQRQVEGAKVGMAHTMGGASGMACSVTILAR